MDKYKFEEMTSKTVCLVEADDQVQGLLWQQYSDDAVRNGTETPTVSWKQNIGVGIQIGEIEGRPVCLSVMWNVLNGQLVGFYSGTSQVVDYEMIEAYLEKTFKNARKFPSRSFISVITYLRTFDAPVSLEPERALGREVIEDFQKGRYLTTRTLEMSEFAVQKGEEGAHEVHDAVKQINELGAAFRALVWQTWLKRDFDALPTSGAKSTVGDLRMLVFTSAGRVMVTLRREEHEDALTGEPYKVARKAGLDVPEEARSDYARTMVQPFLSLLGYTGTESAMYVRGCWGDQETLSKLLTEATKNSELFRQNFGPDTEVGIAV